MLNIQEYRSLSRFVSRAPSLEGFPTSKTQSVFLSFGLQVVQIHLIQSVSNRGADLTARMHRQQADLRLTWSFAYDMCKTGCFLMSMTILLA